MIDILIEPHVNKIVMPENLKVGLMIAEQRKKCASGGCHEVEHLKILFRNISKLAIHCNTYFNLEFKKLEIFSAIKSRSFSRAK